jgi:diguanylate cyclase (GGDEF)-like protein/putative nucleotidyltransferase with HDIG domain
VHGRFAVAGVAACLVFIASARLLAAGLVRAAGDKSVRETALFSPDGLSVDLVLAVLGISLAAFWRWDPWLVFAALAPLVVVHRSLSVPQLQEEARVDPKTGLYNARYFGAALAAEISRAARFGRPMGVIMADLDLLRDVNNTHGHLAGDDVLRGVAEAFASELRHYDVAARFGGEEFSILLPETTAEQALEIAERIRRAVAEREFHVATSPEPLRATLSLGVAAYPADGLDANELVHQADLAVYRAKLQGRNRVLSASSEPLVVAPDRASDGALEPLAETSEPEPSEPGESRARLVSGLGSFAGTVDAARALLAAAGIALGGLALVRGGPVDLAGLLALVALVGGGQAFSVELADLGGSISVSAVGSLAGAALFGYRAALPLAAASVVVEWSARRTPLPAALRSVGALGLASLTAAGIFSLDLGGVGSRMLAHAALGVVAGAVYFVVTTALQNSPAGAETDADTRAAVHDRYAWLLPHYLVYGFIGAVMASGYAAVGLWALAVFAVPLLLMRRTQEAYVRHTRRSSQKLREAAETIRAQNVSLEQANRLLRERSNAAMESLSATVDARDSYTAGHSRRVQQLALALGRQLGLSAAELALLDRAALFHDLGKIAVPDSILLKPAELDPEERRIMNAHSEEGAAIVDRLGFLQDAVPAIRHHHERWDGGGYPHGLVGDEIPLGARIIHVADALDSMLTTRIYRAPRSLEQALAEITASAGSQFCPRCVGALERLLPLDRPVAEPGRLPLAS